MLGVAVVLYLLATISIGLYAANRVKGAKDFMVAGRSLPLYMNFACVFATWFGAENPFVGFGHLYQGWSQRCFWRSLWSRCLLDPRGPGLCEALLSHGLADHRRLLPQALWQRGRSLYFVRHHLVLSWMDQRSNDRFGPGTIRSR